MGDLWGSLFQVGLLVFPLAGLVLIVALILWISKRRSPVESSREKPGEEVEFPAGSHPFESPTPAQRRAATASAAAMAVSGLCLPWAVGISVKIYLDSIGEPTLPVSSFLDPVAVVVLLETTVVQWCSPFLLLAAWVRARAFARFAPGRTFGERLLLARKEGMLACPSRPRNDVTRWPRGRIASAARCGRPTPRLLWRHER